MSAWTIYWILQLDSINSGIAVLVIVGGIFVGFAAIFGTMQRTSAYGEGDPDLVAGKALQSFAFKWSKPLLVVFLAGLFIPSTKTVAAMVVIPAIVNNQAMKAEAGDLYRLAKQALREAVTDKPGAK